MIKIDPNACTINGDEIITEASALRFPPGKWPARVALGALTFTLDRFDLRGEDVTAAYYRAPNGVALCILND